MTEQQIRDEFIGLTNLEEVKKVFRTLAKLLHPDVSNRDSQEEFKILNTIYNSILKDGVYFSSQSKFNLEIEQILSNILHLDIDISIIGDWIWLDGNTKPYKHIFKDLGFRWASKKCQWYWGTLKGKSFKEKSMNEIKAKYGCQNVKNVKSYNLSN